MGFNRLTKNVLNISGLPDRVQNQATTLKALFDQSGVDIKAALNQLMAELEAETAAGNIGADVASVTTKTVQAILTAYEQEIADRYTKLESDTLLSENTNSLVQDVDINLTTGVITVTKKDGTVETYDTAIEKVPARFEIVETNGRYALKITNVDGTSTQTDITNLMNIYTFNNSDTINFAVTGEGNEKTVVANIKANSIGLDKLSLTVVSTLEGYMNSARDSANAAKISENNAKSAANTATKAAETASAGAEAGRVAVQKATEAESYAHGGTGTRPGEDTDNAKYYSQIAKEAAGGDFVTPVEMEAYAQPLGTTPTYETTELSGQEIEVDAPLAMESILHLSGNSEQDGEPSPEFESPIRSVKDKSDNLLPFPYTDGTTKTVNGVTFTANNDGSVTINGTATANAQMYLVSRTSGELKLKGTYTMSGEKSPKGQSIFRGVYIKSDGKEGYIGSTSPSTFTFEEETAIGLYLVILSGETINNLTVHPMLNKGDKALPYQPYGYVPVEFKAEGKNLLNPVGASSTKNGLTLTNNGDGSFTIKGTATSNTAFNLTDTTKYPIKLESGKPYTQQKITISGTPNSTSLLTAVKKDGIITNNYIVNYGVTLVGKKQVEKDYDVDRVDVYVANGSSVDYTFKVQLEEGTEATPYEPYVEPTIVPVPLGDIELRSTPDGIRDTFERVDGVWKKCNKIYSDSSDTIVNCYNYGTATEEYIAFNCELRKIHAETTKDSIKIISNMFQWSSAVYHRTAEAIWTAGENNRIYICIKKSRLADVSTNETALASFKTWLAENPFYVAYALSEPIYTPITDQALISALDELEQLILHKGYNRITATAVNGVKAYLDLSIPATASVTNVVETESSLDMPVLLAAGEGDIKAKVTDKVTVNPATGEVKVKGDKVATIKTLLSTIPDTGWTATSPYTVNVTIPDMLNTDIPHITPVYTGVIATDKAIQEAWSNVDRAVANNGSLQVIAFEEVPTIEIPIQIEVIR